jgi:hypothetical protein
MGPADCPPGTHNEFVPEHALAQRLLREKKAHDEGDSLF